MLHVVFTKLHNLVAEQLVNLNPHWDQKHLFEVSQYFPYHMYSNVPNKCVSTLIETEDILATFLAIEVDWHLLCFNIEIFDDLIHIDLVTP